MSNLSPYIYPILKPLPELIIDAVELKPYEITMSRGKREISDKRFLAMYLIRRKTTLSTAKIGDIFNKKHADVLHATKVITNRMDIYPEFKEKVNNLINTLPDEIYSNREE